MSYKTNIFINCPFDKEYEPMLHAMLFVCIYFDLAPQLSETRCSVDVRIHNINKLIMSSKYSIHDLSRMDHKDPKKLARLNMPFELGIDYGCKLHNKNKKDKVILILDEEKYRIQEALSDLAGDIEDHQKSPEIVITKIRNWFYKLKVQTDRPHTPNSIWTMYNEYTGDLAVRLKEEGWKQEHYDCMPTSEKCDIIREWLDGRKQFEKKNNLA